MAGTGPVVSAVRTDVSDALESIGRVASAVSGVGAAAAQASEMTKAEATKMGAALRALGVQTEADTQKRIQGVQNHIQTLKDLHAQGRLTTRDLESAMVSATEKLTILTRSLGQDTRSSAEKAADALKSLGVTSAKASQEAIDGLKKQAKELEALRDAGALTAGDYDKAMATVQQRIDQVNRSMGADTRTAAEKAADALKALGVTSRQASQDSIAGLNAQAQELDNLRAAGNLTAEDYDAAMAAVQQRIKRVNESLGQDTRTAAEKAGAAMRELGVTSERAAQESIAALNKQAQELLNLKNAGDITASDYARAMDSVNKRIRQVNESLGQDTRTAAEKAAEALKSLGVTSQRSALESVNALQAQARELDNLRQSGEITAEDYAKAMDAVRTKIRQVNDSLGRDTRTAAEKAADALKALGVTSQSASQESIAALNKQAQELGALRAAGNLTAADYEAAMEAVNKRIRQVNETLGNDTRTAAEKAADALKSLGVTSRQSAQDSITALNQQAQALDGMRAAGNLTAEDYEAAMEVVRKKIRQVNDSLGNDTRTAAEKAADALRNLGVVSEAASQDAIAALNKQAQELGALRAAGNITAADYERAMASIQQRIRQVNDTLGNDTRTEAQKAADALKELGVTSRQSSQDSIIALNQQAQALGRLRASGHLTAEDYEAAMEAVRKKIRQVNDTLGNDTRTAADRAADALKNLGVTSERSARDAIRGLNDQKRELESLRNAGRITAEEYERAMAEVQQRLRRVNDSLGNDTRTAAEKAEEALRGLGVTSNRVADGQIDDIKKQIRQLEQFRDTGVISAEEYERAMVAANQRINQANQNAGRQQESAIDQVDRAMNALGVTSERVGAEQIRTINRHVEELRRLRDAGQITADDYRRAFDQAQEQIRTINGRMASNTENAFERMGRAARQYGARVAAVGKGMAMAGFATGAAWFGSGAAATKDLTDQGLEVRRATTAAGLDPAKAVDLERFQRFAYAMRAKVGIDIGASGDILKDVNDKLGDFVETGAGHMVDFAEQVAPLLGVKKTDYKSRADTMSEDQLAALAKRQGKDVEQLTEEFDLEAERRWRQAVIDLIRGRDSIETLENIYAALEKTGVTQDAGKTAFYLEGFASELVLGGSLLANGAAESKRLGQQGAEAGGFIDTVQLEKIDKLRESMAAMGESFRGAALAMMEAGVFEMIVKLTNAVADLFKWVSDNLSPAMLKWGIAFGIIAAVVAPLIVMFGVLVMAFGAISTVIGVGVGGIMLMVGAIVAVIASVVVFWDKIKGLWAWFRGKKDDTQAVIDSDVNIQRELNINAQSMPNAMQAAGNEALHPINLSIGGEQGIPGFFGNEAAVAQLNKHMNNKTALQPVNVSRAQR